MKLRLVVSTLFIPAGLFAPSHAHAQAAPEKSKIICDHAAPPRGMHYVCKSQCDCHLEGKLKNDEDGVAPVLPDTPRVCSYNAPKAGELLVCDSDCKCEPQKENEQAGSPVNSCQRPITIFVPPSYPPIARTNRIAGIVFVQVEVNDDGTVKLANPIEGHPMLTQAAKEAIEHWRFDPSCTRIQMVSVRFRISIDEKNDPSGYTIHPPDEIEIVTSAIQVDTYAAKAKGKNKPKKASKVTSK